MTPPISAVEAVRRLHRHRAWSNAALLQSARALADDQLHQTFPIGQGSVWASLVHLHVADRLWLDALEGRPDYPLLSPADFAGLDALAVAWAEVESRWTARLTDADLDAPVSRLDLAGNLITLPALDAHLQLCTHASYTGAQVVNMLRQLGVSPLPNLTYKL